MDERLLETTRYVVGRLDALEVDHRVLGGMAVYHHGWERSTTDLDLLVDEGGYETLRCTLLDAHSHPSPTPGRSWKDARTEIPVDFFIAGLDRPGSIRAPISFPPPSALPAETGRLPGKFVDLLRLIEFKLFSTKYGRAGERDAIDVVELLRRKPLPRESVDRVHPDVQDLYEYWWKASLVREDPEATYPNLDEVAALLRKGKVTPREAVAMLEDGRSR